VQSTLTEDDIAQSFTSAGRNAASADVDAKRSETKAFMRRARLGGRPSSGRGVPSMPH